MEQTPKEMLKAYVDSQKFMGTKDPVNHIRYSSPEIKGPGADEEGICPICGGELEYGNDISLDEGGVYEWTCPNCGAAGKEGYNKVFDQHYDVQDGDGNPSPLPSSN